MIWLECNTIEKKLQLLELRMVEKDHYVEIYHNDGWNIQSIDNNNNLINSFLTGYYRANEMNEILMARNGLQIRKGHELSETLTPNQ